MGNFAENLNLGKSVLPPAKYVCMVRQGNLKGRFVVLAILPSRMEVSYYTSGFFHS